MTTGSTFNTAPDKITHKRKTLEGGRKKAVRSEKQNAWSQVSWKNHGIRGSASSLLANLITLKLFAEAGQVEAAIKKVQAANIAAYKERWGKKLADK